MTILNKISLFIFIFIIVQNNLFGYIDPGTGSLLFSAIFGIIGTLFFLFKAFLIKIKTVPFYKNRAKINLNNKAKIIIYGEDKRYYNLFKPIIEELIKLEIPLIYYSSSEDDLIFNIKSDLLYTEFIGVGNKAYAKLNFIEADICLMTTPNLDVFQLKRSKGVKKYIHITHSPGSIGVYKMYSLDFFDIVLLNGEHQISDIRELEKLRGEKEKDLYVVGSPYLDELNKKLQKIKESENIKSDSILIAPSWGPNGLLKKFGKKLIDSILTLNYKVIIRPHPQSYISEKEMINSLKEIYKDNTNIEWDNNTDSSYSFLRSTAMISDFSGVIFDYSFLMERPVLIPDFQYKKDGFDAYFLKNDIWQLTVLPRISIKFFENNINEIHNILSNLINDEKFIAEIKKAKSEAYMYINESSKKISTLLFNMIKE
ncbi:CDP-glycerol glycerophosphotransferase family protein [uncultured Brachyspira sp.]|uniref:CDP-glycerol glycerophosphotransferase family protein n=1 Tax=uncultured Brachyspira sp. TaxID=221953 RepID=UPI0026311BE4|nr:CDP-glycerol glycerophosphotransferase family protein [uncultured Brachyspira sp.]